MLRHLLSKRISSFFASTALEMFAAIHCALSIPVIFGFRLFAVFEITNLGEMEAACLEEKEEEGLSNPI